HDSYALFEHGFGPCAVSCAAALGEDSLIFCDDKTQELHRRSWLCATTGGENKAAEELCPDETIGSLLSASHDSDASNRVVSIAAHARGAAAVLVSRSRNNTKTSTSATRAETEHSSETIFLLPDVLHPAPASASSADRNARKQAREHYPVLEIADPQSVASAYLVSTATAGREQTVAAPLPALKAPWAPAGAEEDTVVSMCIGAAWVDATDLFLTTAASVDDLCLFVAFRSRVLACFSIPKDSTCSAGTAPRSDAQPARPSELLQWAVQLPAEQCTTGVIRMEAPRAGLLIVSTGARVFLLHKPSTLD
ncbi:unnamed protein product, partial [Amoebophrya sp. A120]